MDGKSKTFAILAYIYILIPIIIFLIGWCNPFIAIIGTLICVISLYLAIKNAPELWFPNSRKGYFFIFGLFIISLVWVYFSGIGALVFQNLDHNCRNPIFELLINNSWPVIVDGKTYLNTSQPLMLTYYIAFWLPSACIGKLFNSIQIGYYAQILWATFGVFFIFYYILSFLKKKNYIPILIFIFFSGLDFLGCEITHRDNLSNWISHIEWWFPSVQFSSFTTQLFWVFNQAIPAWIITLVLLQEKNNKNIMFLYACMFLHSTLPAIGIFPIIAYLMYRNSKNLDRNLITLKHIKESIKNACTFQNIICSIIILFTSYLYLSGNLSGEKTSFWSPSYQIIVLYIITFLMLEVGIYLLLVLKYNKKEPLFYIITLIFIFYPFIKIGNSADFCMRATIPALTILYLMVVKVLDSEFKKDTLLKIGLIITLLIGAINPIHEFARTIYYTSLGYTKIKSQLKGTNFFSYVDGNRFIKYIGKVSKNNE